MYASEAKCADDDGKPWSYISANGISVEWIKGLLAVPFVLYSQPTGIFSGQATALVRAQEEAHRRYSEILRDVEAMIDDHSECASGLVDINQC